MMCQWKKLPTFKLAFFQSHFDSITAAPGLIINYGDFCMIKMGRGRGGGGVGVAVGDGIPLLAA